MFRLSSNLETATPAAPQMESIRLEEGKRLADLVDQLTLKTLLQFFILWQLLEENSNRDGPIFLYMFL